MSLHDIILGGGVGLALLLTFIQVSSIQINPWKALGKAVTALWRAVGKSLNTDVLAKLEVLETGQRDTRDKLEEHIRLADKREADSYRASILHFNVELIQCAPHTREDFIEILADIDQYERYCESHPQYENNRAVCAIANIKRVYAERLEKHDFL